MAQKKTIQRLKFRTGEYVVYPSHGVGQITDIDEEEIAGTKLELFIIEFLKEKMTLKVPVPKAKSVGMRKLADTREVGKALKAVQASAKIKRIMWSRRAQEYDAKINSGDLIQIAEVVRDLYRSETQPEQSYSERQLYDVALDRMAREVAAVKKVTLTEAINLIETNLTKNPARRPKPQDSGATVAAA